MTTAESETPEQQAHDQADEHDHRHNRAMSRVQEQLPEAILTATGQWSRERNGPERATLGLKAAGLLRLEAEMIKFRERPGRRLAQWLTELQHSEGTHDNELPEQLQRTLAEFRELHITLFSAQGLNSGERYAIEWFSAAVKVGAGEQSVTLKDAKQAYEDASKRIANSGILQKRLSAHYPRILPWVRDLSKVKGIAPREQVNGAKNLKGWNHVAYDPEAGYLRFLQMAALAYAGISIQEATTYPALPDDR